MDERWPPGPHLQASLAQSAANVSVTSPVSIQKDTWMQRKAREVDSDDVDSCLFI